MNLQEKVRLARKAIDKKWDYETLRYGDDLYGHEYDAEEIWDLVEECEEIGTVAFDAIYADTTTANTQEKEVHNEMA